MRSKQVPAMAVSSPGTNQDSSAGGFVMMDGEVHFKITDCDRLEPFLVSLASDTDLWMFVASRGGLTAGRVDANGSLFPYRTVDQLHEAHDHTGPVTLIRVNTAAGEPVVWEPFCTRNGDDQDIQRNLYKNSLGTRIVFEEINAALGLAFRYSWAGCDTFGWVRSSYLENRGTGPVQADVLDGLRNILPHGAPLSLYQQSSNLVDAYKKSEVDPETGLGIFSLTAGITDRAEAVEVLRANTVWCCGLEGHRIHLSMGAVSAFRNSRIVAEDKVLNGARGNYLVTGSLELGPGKESHWHLVGDTGRDHVQISDLRRRISRGEDLEARIGDSLRQAGVNLRRNVASADGLQLTGRDESWGHHFANVLFNNMRGGVFAWNYDVPVADLANFLALRNREVAGRVGLILAELPTRVTIQKLNETALATGDDDFQRLCHEYLPLYFGRRHGDPSRPWNQFSIRLRNRDGERALNYQGNWRDIFQNWEALSFSFPDFLPGIVSKFVNASTVDGYNPYRITRDGVDWEIVEPEDPWSNIGYWGDHQIIYLLKLLESMNQHTPAFLGSMLGAEIFSYAEVPYRIKPYADIVKDPRDTIDFDLELAQRIDERVAARGTDGKLLTDASGAVYHANLLEKLLVPALAKLSNLIPDAGIWMNTQRPEWNDANNALGGGGVSVVTLCYLRRYLAFLAATLEAADDKELPVSQEVVDWFAGVEVVFEQERALLSAKTATPGARKRVMDALGGVFSAYRDSVYPRGFSGKTALSVSRAAELCRTAVQFVDRDIAANRREDGLYHTYNLLDIPADGKTVTVLPLQEMLEGQVAVISSGVLEPAAVQTILERLFASDLYRADQHSFMLYPQRELPGFLAKNTVPEKQAQAIPLLRDLLAANNSALLVRDVDGIIRFRGDFGKAEDLDPVLDELGRREEWTAAVDRDRAAILHLFDDVFQHKSYTGRSGVMYGYEGLGCIYWHMVAKLLLAVQETSLRAEREALAPEEQAALATMYFRIRSGIGYEKSVEEYGAFPIDPYSHTPPGGGAKQPGMTGQVKEEILTRMGELGINVEKGEVRFQPILLQDHEFLVEDREFRYFDVSGEARTIPLSSGSLAFTYCQVPVVYERVTGKAWIHVTFTDGSHVEHAGNLIDASLGDEIHSRTGRLDCIRVGIPDSTLCH